MAHHHELTIIFRADGTEEQVKQLLARTEELIKKEGAAILATESWGRRRFAFPIKKQREGLYQFFRLQAEPAAITRLARACRLEETILRVLIVRTETRPATPVAATPPHATTAT